MFNKELDFVKISIYVSFALAVLLYYLSGRFSAYSLSLYITAVLFLILGLVFVIIKVYSKFKITYDIYIANIKEKRIKLYDEGHDILEINKLIKLYKKRNLRAYRFTNLKYLTLLAFLIFVVIYMLYLTIRIIF